jgi:hypothetical protein
LGWGFGDDSGAKAETLGFCRARRPAGRGARGRRGAEEAVAFIAEQVAGLRKLAARHQLDVLHYLLGMTQFEADEHLRLRSKRKLS